MKKAISLLLILALLASITVTVSGEDPISYGIVDGTSYWNESLSIGCDLGEMWEFTSQEELEQINASGEYDLPILMMAEVEGVVGVILEVEQNAVRKSAYQNEEKYLEPLLPTTVAGYTSHGYQNVQASIGDISFLGENHKCFRLYGDLDDGCIYYTIAVAEVGNHLVSATAYSFYQDITDNLISRFFHHESPIEMGYVTTNAYWNDSLGIGFKKEPDWHYFSYGELRAFNEANNGIPTYEEGCLTTMMCYQDDWDQSASLRVTWMDEITIKKISESSFLAAVYENPIGGGLRKNLEQGGLQNIAYQITDVEIFGDQHKCLIVSGEQNGEKYYEEVLAIIQDCSIIELTAISYDTDSTSELLARFFREDEITEVNADCSLREALSFDFSLGQDWVQLSNQELFEGQGYDPDLTIEQLEAQLDTGSYFTAMAAFNSKNYDSAQVFIEKVDSGATEESHSMNWMKAVLAFADQMQLSNLSVKTGSESYKGETHPWISFSGVDIEDNSTRFGKLFVVQKGSYMLAFFATSTIQDNVDQILNRFTF